MILLHGTDGDENSNWIPWLKMQLEKRGHEVFAPSLPDSAYPNGEKWVDYILENVPFDFDEETVVVGHSAGAALIPMLLQKLPEGTKIRKAILVSGFHDTLGWDKLKVLQNIVVDYDRAQQKANEIVLLHSDNDPYVELEQAEWLAEKLNGELRVIKGQGHFNLGTSPKYKEFPKLLAVILKENALQQLYLMSSFRGKGVAEMVMRDIEQKLGKKAEEVRVLYITTAGNLHPEGDRKWIDEGREILKKRGWEVMDYDIAGKTEEEVRAGVGRSDVVFVQGGNNFYLLKRMQECGFEEMIKKALARGVIYMGESAGSIVCSEDITAQKIMSADALERVPEITDFRGLGLVNFLIRPHWNRADQKREKYLKFLKEYPEEFFSITQPIICLNDNQLVYVEGDEFQIWEGK